MDKQSILVYLEAQEGQIVKVSLEALNAAKQCAAKSGKSVAAVLVNAADAAASAAHYGADSVVTVEAGEYQPERYAHILKTLMERAEAELLFVGSTRDGRELAARVAAAFNIPCVSDATAISDEGFVRSIYGGSLMETIAVTGKAVISVRSGTFGKPECDESRIAPVSAETVADETQLRAVIRESVKELAESVNLEDAEVIVAGGRGMGSAEGFKMVEELAELLGGVVGASRPAIEDGWVPRNHQVGQSGKIVAPKLYIACGISGAMQHVSGMSGSGFIVAINKDEDAPIFDVADVGIVGNVNDILPLMIEEIRARKA